MRDYTEIVEIDVPSEAEAGQLVNFVVRVKNLADYAIYIKLEGAVNGDAVLFILDYAVVNSKSTFSFAGFFNMPNVSSEVFVWCYYWTGDEWRHDDSKQQSIALSQEIPYQGTISGKELKYDDIRREIPVL